MSTLIVRFEAITHHPKGSDVIFYPDPGNDGTPEGILEEVKRWRSEQGLPGFKQQAG